MMRQSQIQLILFVLALGILSFSCSVTDNSLGGGSDHATRNYAQKSSSSQVLSSSSALVIVRSSSSNQPTYIGDTSQPKNQWEVSQDQNSFYVCTEIPCSANLWAITKNLVSWRPHQDTNHLNLLKILDLRNTKNLSLGSAKDESLSGLALQLQLLWYRKIDAESLHLLGGAYYLNELNLDSINLIGTGNSITQIKSAFNFYIKNSNLYQLSLHSTDSSSRMYLTNTLLNKVILQKNEVYSDQIITKSTKPWMLWQGDVKGEQVELIINADPSLSTLIRSQNNNSFVNSKFTTPNLSSIKYDTALALETNSKLIMNQVQFDLSSPIYMNANTSLDWTYGSLSAELIGNIQLIKLRNLEFLGSFVSNAPTPTCFNSYNKSKNLNGFCL